MDPAKTTIILGPPGTGKTTKLLDIMDGIMANGEDPRKICFVAFTRKAANEAKNRAVEKFNLSADNFPLVRTLHSLAFQQLNSQRGEVMGIRDYITIAKSLGIYLTARGINEDGTIVGLSKGDRLLFMDMMSRSRRIPLKEYWEQQPDEDIRWYELEQLSQTVSAYKREQGKMDFIDMIYRFVEEAPRTGLESLIVDEAQDLSTIQWDMVDVLSQEAERCFVAGDDDQAIFSWAGADVQRFLTLPNHHSICLKLSYRCPQPVSELAQSISKRISNRHEKDWMWRDGPGEVQHVSDLSQVDMSKGTWLLLARNIFLLEQLNAHCLQQGHVFDSILGSPIRGAAIAAIIAWEDLRKGHEISAKRVMSIYDMMSSKVSVAHGAKVKVERLPDNQMLSLSALEKDYGLLTDKIWHEALDRIEPAEREYFLAALRSGEKLLKEPRIKISTIHGVKGGEADNVLIITDMAPRTWKEYHEDPDAEHRVWYVAVTRAREKLFIMQPKTGMFYAI